MPPPKSCLLGVLPAPPRRVRPAGASPADPAPAHGMPFRSAPRREVRRDPGRPGRRTRAPAWLAEHEPHPGLPRGEMSPMEDLRAHSRSIVSTDQIDDAARFTAEVGRPAAAATPPPNEGPTFNSGSMPPSGTSVPGHMRRHDWAAERMWEGLVGPSDLLWDMGATALTADPLVLGGTSEANPRANALAREVHDLGTTALGLDRGPPRRRLWTSARDVRALPRTHRRAAAGAPRLRRPRPTWPLQPQMTGFGCRAANSMTVMGFAALGRRRSVVGCEHQDSHGLCSRRGGPPPSQARRPGAPRDRVRCRAAYTPSSSRSIRTSSTSHTGRYPIRA